MLPSKMFLYAILAPMLALAGPSAVGNCSGSEILCGSPPTYACCPEQWRCNYRRGIPICEDLTTQYISGYSDSACSSGNPYLFSCDGIGTAGFCCPVGTSCHHTSKADKVFCINPFGVTTTAFPTATMVTTLPSLTAIPAPAPSGNSTSQLVLTPSDAWTAVPLSEVDRNSACGGVLSPYRLVTNVLNASISFTYTGHSFMVRTIPSKTGGAFYLAIDGFNTTNIIDTYKTDALTLEEARGKGLNPDCYHVRQFPPMKVVPIGYETRKTHTATLVYIGASVDFPGTDLTNLSVQFDSFALEIYSEAQMSSAPGRRVSNFRATKSLIFAIALIFAGVL